MPSLVVDPEFPHPERAVNERKPITEITREASPWRLVDYWSWTREPDLPDFDLR